MNDRRVLPLVLHAIGMAVVVWAFVAGRFAGHYGAWLDVAFAVAIASWVAIEVAPWWPGQRVAAARMRIVRCAAIVVAVVVAAGTQSMTQGALVAPLAIALIVGIGEAAQPAGFGAAIAGLALVITPIGAVASHESLPGLLLYEAAAAVWVLMGVSRRQAAVATRRTAELEAQRQVAVDEQARAALLADRQRAARDIHDVLAHSLGGLVIQLDAAEALLEAGRAAEGLTKVGEARVLAQEGFADARRAVSALRAPEETGAHDVADASGLRSSVEQLIGTHRALGGTVDARIELSGGGTDGAVPPATASAIVRAVQEALSNARRHAPGMPVEVVVGASDGRVELTVANPMPAVAVAAGQRPVAGGGHGLTGMGERFAALPGGSVSAGPHDGRFVVRATAALSLDRS